jgi:hypothetical protein
MGFLGDAPGICDPGFVGPLSQAEIASCASKKAGSVPVTQFSWDQLTQVIDKGLKSWGEVEKQQLANEILLRKNQNKPVYLPGSVLNAAGWSTGEKVALGVGGLALVAGLGFALFYFMGKKKR